jgi:hypothetical protein
MGGMGRGYAWRRNFFDYDMAPRGADRSMYSNQDAKDALKGQAEYLRKSLEAIERRIAEIGENAEKA